MIHNLQCIPIYYEFLSLNNIDSVQEEIDTVVKDLKNKNLLKVRQDWDTSFKISDTVDNNILRDSRLSVFIQEILRHVKVYYDNFNLDIGQIKEFRIVESWVTSSLKGDITNVHSHSLADISGCYYFKTNGNDGSIYFTPPFKMWGKDPATTYFTPCEGKLLLFPSWLEHGVTKNTTETERISISFQIVLVK